jgi:hypothetical protein
MEHDADFYEHEHWGEGRVLDADVYRQRLEGTAALIGRVDGRWLDVGSGDGRFLHDLTSALGVPRGDVVALERSDVAVGLVDGPVVRATGTQLPLRSRAFPLVTAFEMLEHLPVGTYEATLAELARVSSDRVVVTVPNRENRARANVTCPVCGCVHNPSRHLRSFRADTIDALLDGFSLERATEFGHRAFAYPRQVRLALERAGVLARPGHPICPQCGYGSPSGPAPAPAAAATAGADARRRPTSGAYRLARRLSPRTRYRYYLGASFRRGR